VVFLKKLGGGEMARKPVRFILVSLLACLLLSFFTVPVMAYDARGETNITIAGDEVVNDDLYLVGGSITIDGTVNGDVFILGQTIAVNGTVNGGITVAGQTITLNGSISRGARVAGQTITVNGNIAGDLLAATSDLIINQNAVIGRDLVLGSSTALISGQVGRNVLGGAEQVTISNRINGNVTLHVTDLLITSTAVIGGNLTYTSETEAEIQQGSQITGTVDQITPTEPEPRPEEGIWAGIIGAVIFRILSFISIFLIGLILLFLALRHMKLLAVSLQRHPARCLGWGALIFFVTPLAALLVMFTVIGIPLALIALVVWGILLYLSQLPVALVIGWLILFRGRNTVSRGSLIGALALGLFIIHLVSLIPIFGWIFWFFVILFGLGTLVTVFKVARETSRSIEPQ